MPLLDQFGNTVTQKRPIYKPVAVQTVRERYSSYPSHGLTPERLTTLLKEADVGYIERQAELFEEMEEKDLHLQSVIQTRKLAVAGLEWEIQSASEDSSDEKIAEAAREMVEYIVNWEDNLIDILDAIGKGFSVCEINWELAENKIWVKSLEWIHQKRFTFYSKDQMILNYPKLLTDANPVYGEDLTPYKFVFHRHKARSGFTARGGLYRPVSWFYLFKNYDIKDWMVFNDLFAVPMRVGKYQAGATKTEKDVLQDAVFNLGVDAAAIISDSTAIELLESSLRGDISSFKEFADYCDRAITKAVLGHTGSSESAAGRLGNENEANDIRADLKQHDAHVLENTIRHQILAPWVYFNYGAGVGVPKFKFHTESEEDTEKTARVYGILVRDVGFSGIPQSHIYEKFGIPKPEDDELTVQTPVQETPAFSLFSGKGNEQEDVIEAYAGQLESKVNMSPIWKPIERLVNQANSLDELRELLLSAYGEMDTDKLGSLMQMAFATAELAGRFEVATRS